MNLFERGIIGGFMKYPIYILLIFILISCSDKIDNDFADKPKMFLEPTNPVVGENLTIYYNTNDSSAVFQNQDTLYANINFNGLHKDSKFRLMLEKEGRVYKASITVPADAYYFHLSITPKNIYKTNEKISIIVLNADGNPTEGALAEHILYSQSYEEAKEYYAEDEKLYPNNNLRLSSLSNMIFGNYMNSDAILHSADSLYQVIHTNNITDTINYYSTLIACLDVYSGLKEWYKYMDLLDIFMTNEKFKYDYNNIFLYNNISNMAKEILLNELDNKLSLKLREFILTDKSLYFNNLYFRKLIDFNSDFIDTNIINNTIEKLYNIDNEFKSGDDFTETFSSLYALYELEYNNKNYHTILDISNKLFNKFINYSKKDFWKKSNIAPAIGPTEGQIGIVIGVIYDSYVETKDISKAISTILNYINSVDNFTEFNRGSLSLSSIKLFDLAFAQHDYELSKLALNYATKFKSSFLVEKLEIFNNKMKELNIDTLYISEDAKEKSRELSETEATAINSYTKMTESGDSTIFIFLLDDSCPSCNLGLGEAIDTLKSVTNYKFKIIVSSQNDKKELKELYGDNIEIHSNPENLAAVFELNMLPALLVMKQNKLVHLSRNITTSKSAYIKLLEYK